MHWWHGVHFALWNRDELLIPSLNWYFQAEDMAREIGIGTVTVTAVWASDSNSFAWCGVPAMTLNRDGFGMHTRHDIVDYISPWALERSAKLLGYIAKQLANMDTIPFPQEIPEQFMEELGRFYKRFR